MNPFSGIDPIPSPAPNPGKGVWTDPQVALDADDRDAATAMAAVEAATNRTNWLGWRTVNGIEGGGPYTGNQGFAGTIVILAARVQNIVTPGGVTITVTGTPTGKYAVIIKCTVAGTLGITPGPTVRWSKDGGLTFTAPISLLAAVTLALTGTDLTVHFTGGQALAVNDLITFDSIPLGSLITEGPTAWNATGAPALFYGDVLIDRDLTCNSDVAVGGSVNVGGALDVSGGTILEGGLSMPANSIAQFGDKMIHAGDDAFRELRKGDGSDGDVTIEPWKKDLWVVPALPTANRTWTLDPPPNNEIFEATIYMPDTSGGHHLSLENPGELFAIAKLGSIAGGGDYTSVKVMYDGARYDVMASHPAS